MGRKAVELGVAGGIEWADGEFVWGIRVNRMLWCGGRCRVGERGICMRFCGAFGLISSKPLRRRKASAWEGGRERHSRIENMRYESLYLRLERSPFL